MAEMPDVGTFWTVRDWRDVLGTTPTMFEIVAYIQKAINKKLMPERDKDSAISWIVIYASRAENALVSLV